MSDERPNLATASRTSDLTAAATTREKKTTTERRQFEYESVVGGRGPNGRNRRHFHTNHSMIHQVTGRLLLASGYGSANSNG